MGILRNTQTVSNLIIDQGVLWTTRQLEKVILLITVFNVTLGQGLTVSNAGLASTGAGIMSAMDGLSPLSATF